MNYLSTDEENKLSMNDFLNIMTCNTPLPKDNDSMIQKYSYEFIIFMELV